MLMKVSNSALFHLSTGRLEVQTFGEIIELIRNLQSSENPIHITQFYGLVGSVWTALKLMAISGWQIPVQSGL